VHHLYVKELVTTVDQKEYQLCFATLSSCPLVTRGLGTPCRTYCKSRKIHEYVSRECYLL